MEKGFGENKIVWIRKVETKKGEIPGSIEIYMATLTYSRLLRETLWQLQVLFHFSDGQGDINIPQPTGS